MWPEFADAGCVFVVSAFESVDDRVLARLDKGHTAADAARAVDVLRAAGIDVRPSWLPFTPWTTRDDLVALLDFVYDHDLVGSVDPVQYSVRLLLPRGSLLLGHPDLAPFLGPWHDERSTFTWVHPDPAIDALQRTLSTLVEGDGDPVELYAQVREAVGAPPVDVSAQSPPVARASPRAGSAAPNPPSSSFSAPSRARCHSKVTASAGASIRASTCASAGASRHIRAARPRSAPG